jgi:hypothetical protein
MQSLPGPLWDHSLKGGMGLISDGDTSLETYFEVREIASSGSFEFEGIRLQTDPTTHVTSHAGPSSATDFHRASAAQTFITTDTQFCPDHLTPYYAAADLIFHDCEIGRTKTGVHSHYDDLVSLPQTVRAKIWLYDYQPIGLPDVVSDGLQRAGHSRAIVSSCRRGIPCAASSHCFTTPL